MRKICLIISLLVVFAAASVRAETFKLTTGETVTGELLSAGANEQGIQIKVGEGQYTRVPWTSFSQEDLKTFAKNSKMEPLVEPYIEITQAEKLKKTEFNLKYPPRLERPARQPLLSAIFSSTLGVFVMLLIYAAGVYAGYEVAIFRGRSPLLVAGLSAIPVLGFVAPIVFLCLSTEVKPTDAGAEAPAPPPAEPGAEAAAATDTVNPMQGAVAHPAGLKLHTEAPEAKPAQPQVTVYQRGQYTFNRRFIETKFAGFFGVVRRDAEKNLLLVIKSARGEHVTQHISRIAANDMHITVQHGPASQEVMIPFQEIQEIKVKPKDA